MSHTTDRETVYLDYNATTPVVDEVAETIESHLGASFGNPSSQHPPGRRARRAVEEAREQLAALLGADTEEILFTSGGTESNNLALRGACRAVGDRGELVTSAIEHPAVEATCEHLAEEGWRVERVGVDEQGRLDVDAMDEVVDRETDVVTVMHANNETGVVQPLGACADIADEAGALFHTDAAQTVGKLEVDVDSLGVDLLTVAGHKFHAPKGIGALYVREGTPLEPILFGASHEQGLRPGTEPVPAIVGLGAASELAERTLAEASSRMERLRDRLWEALQEEVSGLELNGHPDRRLPNTLNVRFPEVRGDQLLAVTPEIAASTGSACQEGGGVQASRVVTSMGVDPDDAVGSVRLSLGRPTTADEIDRAVEALVEGRRQLR